MKAIRILPLLLGLAACGVDGPPIPPSQVPEEERPARSNILITGSAGIGVSRRL
jgi:predicted small lipoprotein YifL